MSLLRTFFYNALKAPLYTHAVVYRYGHIIERDVGYTRLCISKTLQVFRQRIRIATHQKRIKEFIIVIGLRFSYGFSRYAVFHYDIRHLVRHAFCIVEIESRHRSHIYSSLRVICPFCRHLQRSLTQAGIVTFKHIAKPKVQRSSIVSKIWVSNAKPVNQSRRESCKRTYQRSVVFYLQDIIDMDGYPHKIVRVKLGHLLHSRNASRTPAAPCTRAFLYHGLAR